MCRHDRDELDRDESTSRASRARGQGADRESLVSGDEPSANPDPGVVVPLTRRRARVDPPRGGPDDDDPGPAAA